MPGPPLPNEVRTMLGSQGTRMHHALWHSARNRVWWKEELGESGRAQLEAAGWKAPRFDDEAGSGLDFLFMHRRMIRMVNARLREVGDPAYPEVVGWRDLPFEHSDPIWPMPPAWEADDARIQEQVDFAKSEETTAVYRRRYLEEFTDRSWLRSQSLDALGRELEFTIHGWMHLHWAEEPSGPANRLDVDNDWLGSPFSSHVNDHFWKLHGWIDERIEAWEDARGERADFTGAWEGAPGFFPGRPHTADPAFFERLGFAQRPPLLMKWNDRQLEGVRD